MGVYSCLLLTPACQSTFHLVIFYNTTRPLAYNYPILEDLNVPCDDSAAIPTSTNVLVSAMTFGMEGSVRETLVSFAAIIT